MLVAPSSVCPTPREAMFVRMTAASWEALSPSMHALNEVLGMVNYDPDEEDVLTDTPSVVSFYCVFASSQLPRTRGNGCPYPVSRDARTASFLSRPHRPGSGEGHGGNAYGDGGDTRPCVGGGTRCGDDS